jgi:tripartite-type tricarboxylate transporter receptor subunit TctC
LGVTGQGLGFHRAGNFQTLAITSPQPLFAAPEIPTTAQAVFPGLTYSTYNGLLAPALTPNPIIEQIAL